MRNLKWFLALALMLILCGSNSYATLYDYGDATGYANAIHSNPSWQRLGTSWDSESSAKAVDTSDDGVFWSTDGSSWGHSEILAGQTVTFRFDMYKELWGRHDFDALKVWIDWNQDKDFTDPGEMVYLNQWNFKDVPDGIGATDYAYGDGIAQISKSFFTDIYIAEDLLPGDYWLRARVACNADIGSNFNNMYSTGHIWQGEVEDWKFTVASVPEPATMLLLGTGLVGLAAFGRKNFLKK